MMCLVNTSTLFKMVYFMVFDFFVIFILITTITTTKINVHCGIIINNKLNCNNDSVNSKCDLNTIMNSKIIVNNNHRNHSIKNHTKFHYLQINNFTFQQKQKQQPQQQQKQKQSNYSYNKNVNINIRPIIISSKLRKDGNYSNDNYKTNLINKNRLKEILEKCKTNRNRNNTNSTRYLEKIQNDNFYLLTRNKKSSSSSSTTSPSTQLSINNNKSFSLVLVNHFKVSEVFEKEFRNKIINNTIDSNRYENDGKIVLLGLFELSTKYGDRPEGLSELGAAQMAVKHINEKRILPGYTLELITNDTQCDPGIGVDRFFHALYTQHSTRMIMLLGSACSEVTESLAKVVPYWNIVQVSFGSTSPALSDRHEFPFFYRTVAPDSSHNPARIAFIRKFGWDTVTTFSQNEEVHSLAVNDLVTELESANISCAATITFAETDFKEQLLLLRELDTRIIIGSFSQELAPKIFCEAFKLGMFGADYAWILHEGMVPSWWNLSPTDCFQHQLQEAVENLIIVSSHNSIVGNEVSFSGLSNDMFAKQLSQLNVPIPLSRYAPQTYDAVWAIALALRGAEEHWKRESLQSKLDTFDYTRYDMALEFLHQLGRLNFLGVSGPVSFSGPDRIGTSAFYQIQNGLLEPVALYYPAKHNLDFNCPNCKNIKWHSGQVPIAKRIFKVKVVTIAPIAFYTIATLASVGVALAIAFLAFNLHFRKLKAIKLSSPKLSNITAVGCILVYAAVVLLGLDYSTLPSAETSFPAICTARVYLLSAGFSLAFGSMFAKTYRVHRIFTHTGSSICKDKMLQDTQLISLVCALLLLDGLVVTLWVVTDPLERHLNNLTLEISSTDRSVVYQPQVEVCRSQYTQSWLGALYVYKGLLLIVGVYMAWETRHVKIPALNDSQYIGVSVYSVVITSAIVVVLANLISERVTLAFITITALILASTTATLLLLFLPKLNDIWSRGDTIDPVIHSMGLRMECNTRRFVTDDRRELQYRVEVQNRVYKKEIAALDAEIRKLEKLLESNPSTSTSSNASLKEQQIPEVSIIAEALSGLVPPVAQPTISKSRTPSITGGLPYLLLSVLPPVIPRASWPSAEYMQVPMRRSVTFASHPQLEDSSRSVNDVCLPAADLLNLRLVHQHATEAKTGIINKIRGIFIRSSSSKGSSNSLNGPNNDNNPPTGSIRAALKCHMGMITKFIPTAETSASCNALYNVQTNTMKPMQKSNLAKSGNDIDQSIIVENLSTEKKCIVSSSADKIDNKFMKLPSETRVSFLLPSSSSSSRRPSLANTTNFTNLRERAKGSPRFPHRIIPTCSLSALEEKEKENQKATLSTGFSSGGRSLSCVSTSINWKSMEYSTTNINNSKPVPTDTTVLDTQQPEVVRQQTNLQSDENNSSNSNNKDQIYVVSETVS